MNGTNGNGLSVVFQGGVVEDAVVSSRLPCTLSPDGVSVRDSRGQDHFIPFAGPPGDRSKVSAAGPIRPLLDRLVVDEYQVGGGAIRAAVAASQARNGRPVKLHFLNEAEATPKVVTLCKQAGIDHIALDRFQTPTNLVILRAPNRLIIKEPLRRSHKPVAEARMAGVHAVLGGAAAVVCVSPEDPFAAETAFQSANAPRKFLQPTGSLPPGQTLKLARLATDIQCNLAELGILTRWAGLAMGDVPEEAPRAPQCAADGLRRLRAKRLAGTISAVVTLGRKGAVAADWVRGRIYFLAFSPRSDRAVVPTPSGTGDMFLGSFVVFDRWAAAGHLKEPVMASAVRATKFVASKLGLRRDSYDIDVKVMWAAGPR